MKDLEELGVFLLQIILTLVATALIVAWVALVIFIAALFGPLGWLVGAFVLMLTLAAFSNN